MTSRIIDENDNKTERARYDDANNIRENILCKYSTTDIIFNTKLYVVLYTKDRVTTFLFSTKQRNTNSSTCLDLFTLTHVGVEIKASKVRRLNSVTLNANRLCSEGVRSLRSLINLQ